VLIWLQTQNCCCVLRSYFPTTMTKHAPMTLAGAGLALTCASTSFLLSGYASPLFLAGLCLCFAVWVYSRFEHKHGSSCLLHLPKGLSLHSHPYFQRNKNVDASEALTGQATEGCAPATSPLKLRLLTYNMLLRPPFINYNGNDYKNERLQIFIEQVLPRYDVVALQEVFWFMNTRLPYLLQEAKKAGFCWYCTTTPPPALSRKFIDGGLVILSRYPIVETKSRLYSSGVQIDGWAAKQGLYAKIQITPSSCIHVFTTHTQADYASNPTNKWTAQARMHQIEELAEMVRDVASSDPTKGDLFVMGDLNVDARAHNSTNNKERQKISAEERSKWGKWGEEDKESDEYVEMMKRFRDIVGKDVICTNLLQEAHGGIHPVTIGDVKVRETGEIDALDVVLTDPVTDMFSRSCLDYILHFKHKEDRKQRKDFNRGLGKAKEIESDDVSTSTIIEEVVVDTMASRVEPFFLDPKVIGLPCTQLSDHYGLSASLDLVTRKVTI
jgi:endonuclease/exonuclease/phosphatase family metal-dependent hydrolase